MMALLSAFPWGSLLGGITGVFKKWLDDKKEMKLAELQAQEKAADRAHDVVLMNLEIEKSRQAGQFALDTADISALTATAESQDREISAMSRALDGSWSWVKSLAALFFMVTTVIQKLTRPGLTVALFVLTVILFFKVQDVVGSLETLGMQEVMSIYSKIIMSCLNMTEAAIMFWFTSRPPKNVSS